jgi:hypothetical protein
MEGDNNVSIIVGDLQLILDKQLRPQLMEQHSLKNKQLHEYKHLLLLRDIWWSKL